MMNSMRAKIGFNCTNYIRSIVALVNHANTALNKFHFHSLRNKMINLVPVVKYHFDFQLLFDISKKNAFSKVLLKSCLLMVHATTWHNLKCCWETHEFNKYTTRLKMQHLWILFPLLSLLF